MTLLRVDGYTGLRKDQSNGGVINVDKSAYEAHKIAREVALRNIAEKRATESTMQSMQSEINNMKDDISEIKMMLAQLLSKANNGRD